MSFIGLSSKTQKHLNSKHFINKKKRNMHERRFSAGQIDVKPTMDLNGFLNASGRARKGGGRAGRRHSSKVLATNNLLLANRSSIDMRHSIDLNAAFAVSFLAQKDRRGRGDLTTHILCRAVCWCLLYDVYAHHSLDGPTLVYHSCRGHTLRPEHDDADPALLPLADLPDAVGFALS